MPTMPPTTTNITETNNHLALIYLNINGLSSSIKTHKLTDWICKQDAGFCCMQKKKKNKNKKTKKTNKKPHPSNKNSL